jgi:hypothetical protein
MTTGLTRTGPMTMALTRALLSLAEDNIPTDTQGLLLTGDPMRRIPAGALVRACLAFNSENPDGR